jgi:hypothetical protein
MVRTGAAVPLGNISGAQDDGMGNDFGVQIPLILEIGIKVHPMVFLGAYGGPSVGPTSSNFSTAQGCGSGSQRGCIAADWRVGLEVQVHFRPAELLNPWVSYGLGFEAASATASGGGSPPGGATYTGLELARLAGGVDFRLSRIFGIGPYVGFDFGSYSAAHPQGQPSESISNTSLHEWLTLGVRGVLFP